MQLFAYNNFQELLPASLAGRHCDYHCPECGGVVRLRGGQHRRKHFFHLALTQDCTQRRKGMVHIQVQCLIERSLPRGECSLEKRFPSINRIADACWESQKIIFEVQCAGMSAEEAFARNRDYQSIGYQVVWILHDSRYNRWRMTAFEKAILSCPHYFTNIDADGNGQIYDQWQWVEGGVRRARLWPLPINLQVLSLENIPSLYLTKERSSRWPFHFDGDLLALPSESDYIVKAAEKEEFFLRDRKKGIIQHIIRGYKILFHYLLEHSCH